MNIKKFLQENKFLDKNGKLNDRGWQLFSLLLDFVGPYPDLTPGRMPSPYDIFDKFLSKVVPASQELILIKNKQIYLTYRKDKWWQGWHTPGGTIRPRETIEETCQRIADNEIPGIQTTNARIIEVISALDNPRFHNVILLVKADFKGKPTGGKWFPKFPPDFLEAQHRYIPILLPYLK